MARSIEQIEVDRIFLYEENPRHEPLNSQEEIITHLCNDEQVFNLARSLSEKGPNPLELLGVIQIEGSGKASTKKNYEVWEGNRRLCALKLLNDPDLAPPHLRKDLEKLASTYKPIKTVPAVIFTDHDELKFWMGIIHGGQQEGIGRKTWNAEQKTRHTGSGRNKVAQSILDLSESFGLISKEERSGKLTTAQRFLNSSVVREALGIDTSNPDDITYNRPLQDFQKQLGRFVADLKDAKKVTSRHNREQIDQYGRKLAGSPGLSGERVEPMSIKTAAVPKVKKGKRKTPKKPKKLKHVDYDKDLARAIEGIGNNKLESLYYSICAISVDDHAPLVTVGSWAFVECLSALAGRNETTDFHSFYSNHKLGELGIGSSKSIIRDALQRIQRNGNATKHHQVSASFDGKQLANDMATVTPLLLKTVEIIAAKK